MRGITAILTTAILLGAITATCHAQDFSADVAYDSPKTADASNPAAEPVPSKLYVSKDKMRLEPQGFSNTIMLVDLEDHSATLLFPKEKAYQQLATAPTQYFRVADPEDACPDWQRATNFQMNCSKVGNEELGGRKAIRYTSKTTNAADSVASVWVDPVLKFVIKWEDADGGAELRNIKEGAQSADLFTVPSGYEVLKPRKKPTHGAGVPK